MVRILVILSFCACDVGALPGFGPDASDNKMDGSGSGSAVCETISSTPPDGHHNPGLTCVAAGCHLAGQEGPLAPTYSYGGTLYSDVAGTVPLPGATILVTLGGTTKKIVTANNGNFWMTPGAGGLEAPTNAMTATTKASGCPSETAMVGPLVQGGNNCNNCHHTPGGTTSPIHLP